MTAPRKPVAWISPVALDGIQSALAADRPRLVRATVWNDEFPAELATTPLYTAPDLQPLWARVEEWEAISKTHTSQLVREAHADFASELRATLEAMQ